MLWYAMQRWAAWAAWGVEAWVGVCRGAWGEVEEAEEEEDAAGASSSK